MWHSSREAADVNWGLVPSRWKISLSHPARSEAAHLAVPDVLLLSSFSSLPAKSFGLNFLFH